MIVPFIALTRYFINNNKCRPSSFPKKCVMVNKSLANKFPQDSFSSFIMKLNENIKHYFPECKESTLLLVFITKFHPVASKLMKSNSVVIVKNCLEQIEFVVAQRIRRSQQMITLYARLWDERALKLLFQKLKRIIHKNGKTFIIGASLFSFDWERERIPIDEMKRHTDELKICEILRSKAFNKDDKRTCTAPDCICLECNSKTNVNCWEPFIIEEDITVWKMEDKDHTKTGLYCYKLYGKYSDVTADDFLEVFLDTENRPRWDSHAAVLQLVDSEPSSQSDVIYWETKWPALFSNRDYVFKRRYYKDEQDKVIIIMNKSTEHPQFPPSSSKARVTEYWSYMVIKPKSNFNEPGMEFSLTYFDNPGISLPTAISLWVTVQGMPEYLKRLRSEALNIGVKRKLHREQTEEEPEDTPEEERCACADEKQKEVTSVPTSPRSPPPPTGREPYVPSTYDYVFIFSSFFQKVKTSLWL